MIYLLDVSTLLAWLWENHEHHRRVMVWQHGKLLATCPITELGFLRISTQPAFGATVAQARNLLAAWQRTAKPKHINCDLPVLRSKAPPGTSQTTDFYLASLAEKHQMKWATLDANCRHPAAFVLSP